MSVNAGIFVEERANCHCFVPPRGVTGLLPREEGSDSPVKCLNNAMRGS